jgi:hypothetical protein
MSLTLINNGNNETSQYGEGTELNPYYWYSYDRSSYPYNIFFTINQAGRIIIEDGTTYSPDFAALTYGFDCPASRCRDIYRGVPLIIHTSNATTFGSVTRKYFNAVALNLKIWFVPDNGATSTTTSTTTQQPIGSKVFIHVGDINIPDNSCGRYKLTLDGAKSSYFSIYGKRVYLTTYPENTGVYSVNVCAKDIANRYTPVCDTFDITIKKCVFTTEPPTTTAAPNFGYVHSENSVSPVSQYTYNKIYGIKKK